MMPRLAESADGLWSSLKQLSRVGLPDPVAGGVEYPVLLVPALGYFTLESDGRLAAANEGEGGLCHRLATDDEVQQLHRAIDQDQAMVVTLSPPGFRSGYRRRVTRQVLHQPRGRWPAPAMAS